MVYLTDKERLLALRSGDGSVAWQTSLVAEPPSGCPSCLQVVGARVIVLQKDGSLQGFDARSGALVWGMRLAELPRRLCCSGWASGWRYSSAWAPTYAEGDPAATAGQHPSGDASEPGEPVRQPFRTAEDLHAYVKEWMPLPKDRIGSLKDEDYWAVVNFILIANDSAVPPNGVNAGNASTVNIR